MVPYVYCTPENSIKDNKLEQKFLSMSTLSSHLAKKDFSFGIVKSSSKICLNLSFTQSIIIEVMYYSSPAPAHNCSALKDDVIRDDKNVKQQVYFSPRDN